MTSDANNVILNEPYIVQSGKDEGKVKLRAYAFYPTVPLAVQGFLDQNMRESSARSLKTLCAQYTALIEGVTKLFDGLLPECSQCPQCGELFKDK